MTLRTDMVQQYLFLQWSAHRLGFIQWTPEARAMGILDANNNIRGVAVFHSYGGYSCETALVSDGSRHFLSDAVMRDVMAYPFDALHCNRSVMNAAISDVATQICLLKAGFQFETRLRAGMPSGEDAVSFCVLRAEAEALIQAGNKPISTAGKPPAMAGRAEKDPAFKSVRKRKETPIVDGNSFFLDMFDELLTQRLEPDPKFVKWVGMDPATRPERWEDVELDEWHTMEIPAPTPQREPLDPTVSEVTEIDNPTIGQMNVGIDFATGPDETVYFEINDEGFETEPHEEDEGADPPDFGAYSG